MRPTPFNVEFNSALNSIGRISCREKFNRGTMVQQFDFWAAIVAPIKKKLELLTIPGFFINRDPNNTPPHYTCSSSCDCTRC